MNIEVLGSTKLGERAKKEDLLTLSGLEAGICYMPSDYETLLGEPLEKTQRRINAVVANGHHSVTGHPSYNLLLIDIPKILAMLLNNEKEYTTSEKSGRYTVMSATNEELYYYEKWRKKFAKIISAKHPELSARIVNKLAMENARYFISVFTPATTMGYTVSLRQANYLIGFCEQMIAENNPHPFYQKLIPYLVEFVEKLREILNVEGLRDNFGRGFSLFATRTRNEHFGDVYSANYFSSFAGLAQAQRHRPLWYEMRVPDDIEDVTFYVPPILEDEDVATEYLADMHLVSETYPQGMLVEVNERGTIDAFIMKCRERLCGAAQLEICLRTKRTLGRYIHYAPRSVALELEALEGKTKCQMGFNCQQPCALGARRAFSRTI